MMELYIAFEIDGVKVNAGLAQDVDAFAILA